MSCPSLPVSHTPLTVPLPTHRVPVPVLIHYVLTSCKIIKTHRRASVLHVHITMLALTHSC